MVQATLDHLLVRKRLKLMQDGQVEQQEQVQHEERGASVKPTVLLTQSGCQASEPATQNHLIRSLLCQSTALHSSRRTRAELQHHVWGNCQQVCAYAAGVPSAADDHNTISSVAIHSTLHRVAFVQAGGVVSLYSLSDLIQDASRLRARADRLLAASTSEADAGLEAAVLTDITAADAAAHDDNVQPAQASSRSIGTRISSSHRYSCLEIDHQDRMSHAAGRAAAVVEHLPSTGCRIDAGLKLEDVVWSTHQEGALALAGWSASQLLLLQLDQGRRTKRVLTARSTGSALGCSRLSGLTCMTQGPYTLAAATSHGPSVFLWDERQGPASITQLVAPARASLTGCLQASPDGHLLYAVTQASQLLVWDLRKGSNSSSVMQFGATGLYSHPLLMQLHLAPALATAMQSLMPPPAIIEGAMGPPPSRCSLAPVDQILLDPTSPNRLGVVLQDCSAAVLHLPSCTVSHMCLPPNHHLGQNQPQLLNTGYSLRRKRGCWAAGGDQLLIPHMHHVQQTPTTQPQEPTEAESSYVPAVGVMDCRHGCFARPPWCGPSTQSRPHASGALQGWHAAQSGSDMSCHIIPPTGRSSTAAGVASKAVSGAISTAAQSSVGLAGGGGIACRPRDLVPVTDWVTCMAAQQQGHEWVLAGTQQGQLLMLGTA